MFTARPQKNLQNAKLYFGKHLGTGDAGLAATSAQWFGKGVGRLGLDSEHPVTAQAFEQLCDNLHPVTGLKLTPLNLPDRRIYFDFVVSAPKSVSLLALTAGDHRLFKLHFQAVRTALARLEEFAATRVRAGGKDEDR